MMIGEVNYNSCGHFERLADIVSFEHADLAVDGQAARLVDAERGLLTDVAYVEMPTYTADHIKGRNIGTIAAHVERAKTATPRMTVVVRIAMMERKR